MEPEEIQRLKDSWAQAGAHPEKLAEAFYGRLFELDPRIRDLFAPADMADQGAKFITMMSEMVRCASDPERLGAMLRESGRRHVGYGVVPRDYHTVGEAFLWALDHALPGGLDSETRAAWARAYSLMASLMQSGHHRAKAAHGGFPVSSP